MTAHRFGPFVDQKLDLAPGMTIVHGPNESGKSSWHAALYAGLCGMRRGRGSRQKDRAFFERHHPWDTDAWEVSEIIRLEDGRNIELHHDLQGKVDCQANDVDLGRDYSNEIIHDGAPDGARWLGLDRRSFLSTACIQQTDILSIIGQADALQEHLQRAAATAGVDATAAAALTRLAEYRRVNVGQYRANSGRPLPAARRMREQAQNALEDAREAHSGYLRQLDELKLLADQMDDAMSSLHVVEAARAAAQAQCAEEKFNRAREIASRYPEEPSGQIESSETADAVKIALHQWDERPDSVVLEGRSAAEFRTELFELPAMPEGDISPHESVSRAKVISEGAHSRLQRCQKDKPAEPNIIPTGDLDARELRAIAAELALEEPAVDLRILERLAKAREQAGISDETYSYESSDGSAGKGPLVLRPLKYLARGFLAAIRILFRRFGKGADQTAYVRALEELRELETEHSETTFRIEDVRRRRGLAKDRAQQNSVPVDSTEWVGLADQLRMLNSLEWKYNDGSAKWTSFVTN